MNIKPWFILYQGKKKFAGIGQSILAGAMLSVYDNRDQADRAVYRLARRFKQPFLVRELEDPVSAVRQFAEDGYAGLLLNDKYPVTFLIDRDGATVGIKNSPNGSYFLLTASDQWQPLSEITQYRPPDNFDAIDLLLRNSLGIEPFWGKSAHVGFSTLAYSETSGHYYDYSDRLSPDDIPLTDFLLFPGKKMVALFRNRLAEPLRSGLDIVPISNIIAFVKLAWHSGHGVVLNPDEHRALQGRFWVEGDSVFFESYSGVWRLTTSDTFEQIHLPYRTDQMLDSCAYFVLRQHGRLRHVDYDRRLGRVVLPIHVIGSCPYSDDETIRQFTVAVEQSFVENGEIQPIVTSLRDLIATGAASRFKSGLSIKFYGYSEQKLAPFEMPGPRSWYSLLFRECPWLTYFLTAEADQLRSFVLALNPHSGENAGDVVGEELLQTILMTTAGGMRLAMLLGEDPGEVMEKVFEQFDLEPDADIYEDLLKKSGETVNKKSNR